MTSEFRKNKIQRWFEFLDQDKSGTVEKADFLLVVDKVKKSRGLSDGDERLQKLTDFITKVWDGVQKEADTDGDGRISLDDWVLLWDRYVKNPAPYEWQTGLTKLVFKVLDAKGDEAIDAEEFVGVTTSFGRKKEEAEIAFKKISKGKPSVSFEDFQALWNEYVSSEDKEAPGNFIFGRTSF